MSSLLVSKMPKSQVTAEQPSTKTITFSMIQWMLAIWSLVPLPFLNPIWTVHILLKPDLENFENYFASMWDECNCAVVWAFFGIAFLLDWNESWPFPVLWPLLSFPNLLASGPITSWEIDGETVETVSEFIFLGSKITADGDCSHEIKRCLLLGKKVMTDLDSILKCRDITLPTKSV